MPRYWTGLVTAGSRDFGGRSAIGAGWNAVMGRAPEGYPSQRPYTLWHKPYKGRSEGSISFGRRSGCSSRGTRRSTTTRRLKRRMPRDM